MFRGILTADIVSLPWRGGCARGAGPILHRAITEQEAHAIAVDAYVYFYPIMSMDIYPQAIHQRRAGKEASKAR